MINSLYKNFRRFGLALLACALLNPANDGLAQSKQEEVSLARFSLDVNSKYLLRGVPLSDKFVLQPSLTLSKGEITSSVFGVIDPNHQDANEADISVDYTKPLSDNLSASIGYSYANFSDIGEKTQEVYGGLIYNGKINPSIFTYWDYDFLKGVYIEASIPKKLNLKRLNLETKLSLAYNHKYFREDSGFSHLNFYIGIPLKIKDKTIITPKLNYMKALGKFHIDDLDKDFKDNLFYGVSVTTEF